MLEKILWGMQKQYMVADIGIMRLFGPELKKSSYQLKSERVGYFHMQDSDDN